MIKLDLLPIFQSEEGMRRYLTNNFRRIQDVLVGATATTELTPENWHIVGAAGEPAFGSGWVAVNGTSGRFRKHMNTVYLGGQVTGTALGTIFTLPDGYRPSQYTRFATNTFNGSVEVHGLIEVNTSGTVRLISGSLSGWVSLDPVIFQI